MRETTSAVARVAVLVIMTGMFAVAWSNDQQTQSAFIVARREAARAVRPIVQTQVSPATTTCRPTAFHAECERNVMQVTVELPLPAEITPGTFRVVQPSGAMFTVNVSCSGKVTASPRDVYVVEVAEGERTCFIRIDQPEAVTVRTSTTASQQTSTVR